ncbi:PAQR family membrane homeostasis protein TrhA [Salibacterium qingdaonense]|uniref:Hemolysin III n=1 Tax=Salibacterium qingdaonense TaxID=266892 RepID=A0A1I4I7R5_9BACI|nr:hemolysin III family protein [Salibacterium qingdaonense]SFL50324.1 hemolysin III [Salibacterium qingdaonense]
MTDVHTFSRREEIANAATHAVGIALSIAATTLLIIFAAMQATAFHIVSVSIYGGTMLLLYVSSTLLHSFRDGKTKDLFEIFDHASIYLFIAGTYTPFLFHALDGVLSWTLFGVVWGIALFGACFKAFFVKKFVVISTLFYVAMGWIIVVAWQPLTDSLAAGGTAFLVGGGLLYTVGTIFYVWRHFPYHHAVWHVFVLGGTVLHFFAVLLYVLPLS